MIRNPLKGDNTRIIVLMTLDLALDNKKKLKNLVLKTIANDVVIELMEVTLVRN